MRHPKQQPGSGGKINDREWSVYVGILEGRQIPAPHLLAARVLIYGEADAVNTLVLSLRSALKEARDILRHKKLVDVFEAGMVEASFMKPGIRYSHKPHSLISPPLDVE